MIYMASLMQEFEPRKSKNSVIYLSAGTSSFIAGFKIDLNGCYFAQVWG
jgi:hypothetical protein